MASDFDPQALIEGMRRQGRDDAARMERKRKKERIVWVVCGIGHAVFLAMVGLSFGKVAALLLASVYASVAVGCLILKGLELWLRS